MAIESSVILAMLLGLAGKVYTATANSETG